MRTSTSSERGFSLIELMIASLITMVIMGVAFRTFADALSLNDAVTQLADSSENLRAGTNLLVRDLLEAGRDLPVGGIPIPSGAGSSAIHRPGPDPSYTFDNTSQVTLSTLTTGNAKGPTIDGQPTDMITIVTDDPFLGSLKIYPSTAVNPPPCPACPKLSVDGTSFNVGPSAAWIQGDPNNGIAAIAAGDLIWFQAPNGNTIQTVTKVDPANVYFESGDPFNFNQIGAAAGNITQLLGNTIDIRRVLMYTYYVHEDEPGVPRLMRELNFFPAQALAGVIEDLELLYDLVDGTYNPTSIVDLPYTANSVTYMPSQVRKVTMHVGVRSEVKNPKTKDYLRNHLSTVISIRNLAYVDRYK